MNTMIMNKTFHVCRTGKLQQHYTLYVSTYIHYTESDFSNITCAYHQNLGYNENESITKVEKMMEHWKNMDNVTVDMDFVDVPKREYCDLTAFGFKWKKTKKGFITELAKYYIPIDRDRYEDQDNINDCERHNNRVGEFWSLWKERKTILKDVGFSVLKGDDDQFRLFFRNCPQEELYERMSELDKKIEITGEFICEIKERIKDVSVKCISVNSYKTEYGLNQICIFEDLEGRKLKTKYSGSKYTIEENKDYKLTGTIIKHEILDSEKMTIINRIILK